MRWKIMNFIEVNGGNKVQREICHKVVSHMIKKLLPRFRTLDITVDFVKSKVMRLVSA